MKDERLEEYRRQAKLREQDEERRRRRQAAESRLQQQEAQAQNEARLAALPAEEQHYSQMPRHTYTGIR